MSYGIVRTWGAVPRDAWCMFTPFRVVVHYTKWKTTKNADLNLMMCVHIFQTLLVSALHSGVACERLHDISHHIYCSVNIHGTRSAVFTNVIVDDAFMDVYGLFLYISVGKVRDTLMLLPRHVVGVGSTYSQLAVYTTLLASTSMKRTG